MNRIGNWDPALEEKARELLSLRFSEASGQSYFDFARCQRPDGSYYGTSGTCRKGKPVGPKEMKMLKDAAAAGNKKAKLALDVVEGKKTKAQAKKELGGTAAAPATKTPKPKTTKAKPEATPQKSIEDLKKEYKAAFMKARELVDKGDYDGANKMSKKGLEISKLIDAHPDTIAAEKKRKAEEKALKDKAAKKPPKVDASPEARAAIRNYSSDSSVMRGDRAASEPAYKSMNNCGRSPKDCRPGVKEEMAQFDKALKEMPANTAGGSYYRGFSPRQEVYDQLASLKVGDTFSDGGYSSFSRNPAVAQDFMSRVKPSVLIESRSKDIRAIEQFSRIKKEQEGVLPRGLNQTVREIRQEGNVLTIVVD